MNCTEFAELMVLRLSGEMDLAQQKSFEQHYATCPGCANLLESSTAVDSQLLTAALAETPDPAFVMGRVRAEIRRDQRLRTSWLAVAATILICAGTGAAWLAGRQAESPALASAIRDHRVEVVENRPRRWRVNAAEMQPLMEHYGVAKSDTEALIPGGFTLRKVRECGIGGGKALHMVFSDGTRMLSVYVDEWETRRVADQTTLNGIEAAGFRRGSLTGVVVAAGQTGLCADAVRRLTSQAMVPRRLQG